jgi:hypothetical protein
MCSETSLSHQRLVQLTSRVDLFPDMKGFFMIIDEAQVAADGMRVFQGPSRKERPLLYAFYEFLITTGFHFKGIIISGTGLSIEMMHETKVSMGKFRKWPNKLFFETGLFQEEEIHKTYLYRFLKLSANNVSDQRLVERILRWFSGR